jgi:hypothetical protein
MGSGAVGLWGHEVVEMAGAMTVVWEGRGRENKKLHTTWLFIFFFLVFLFFSIII